MLTTTMPARRKTRFGRRQRQPVGGLGTPRRQEQAYRWMGLPTTKTPAQRRVTTRRHKEPAAKLRNDETYCTAQRCRDTWSRTKMPPTYSTTTGWALKQNPAALLWICFCYIALWTYTKPRRCIPSFENIFIHYNLVKVMINDNMQTTYLL